MGEKRANSEVKEGVPHLRLSRCLMSAMRQERSFRPILAERQLWGGKRTLDLRECPLPPIPDIQEPCGGQI